MKKIILIIFLALMNGFCAETFQCKIVDNDTTVGFTYNLWLKAVYVDGVLRGELREYREFNKEDNKSIESDVIRVRDGVIHASSAEGHIKLTQIITTVKTLQFKGLHGETVYTQYADFFKMPLSKGELDAARMKSSDGKKCLSIWFGELFPPLE